MAKHAFELFKLLNFKKGGFLAICFFFLSAYPIYKNYSNGEAIATYNLFKGVIEKRSKFYNPWQYRILCPLIIEGSKRVYDCTIDRILPIDRVIQLSFHPTSGFTPETKEFLEQLNDPDIAKYVIIFLLFRFIEDFILLVLCFFLIRYFIKNNDWLILLALILVSWSMGNGVSASDLTFNTYLDNILYLLAGCIIVYKKNSWCFVPITIIGALNRETSLLIPYLLFISNFSFKYSTSSPGILFRIKWPSRKIFLISGFSFFCFFIIFIGLRWYFGYRPQDVWKVPVGIPMLELNVFSFVAVKGYFEMFGAFSILPMICIYKFKASNLILRTWFIGIVPMWFFVHFYSVPSYESRLFFVPTYLIFIPMALEIIYKNVSLDSKAVDRNLESKGPCMPG